MNEGLLIKYRECCRVLSQRAELLHCHKYGRSPLFTMNRHRPATRQQRHHLSSINTPKHQLQIYGKCTTLKEHLPWSSLVITSALKLAPMNAILQRKYTMTKISFWSNQQYPICGIESTRNFQKYPFAQWTERSDHRPGRFVISEMWFRSKGVEHHIYIYHNYVPQ